SVMKTIIVLPFLIIFVCHHSCFFSSSFLFLLICKKTRSILFTYTTLFRSLWICHRQQSKSVQVQILITTQSCALSALKSKNYLKDRKSTRLNSSHVSISYAVFCLKKKTRKTKIEKERKSVGLFSSKKYKSY